MKKTASLGALLLALALPLAAQAETVFAGEVTAETAQVIRLATTVLGLKKPPKPDDTADALAIAICHGHSAASRIGAYYNN